MNGGEKTVVGLYKAEVVILTKKRIPNIVPYGVKDYGQIPRGFSRYKNIFHKIRHSEDKAAKSVTALSRLMTNVSGPRPVSYTHLDVYKRQS